MLNSEDQQGKRTSSLIPLAPNAEVNNNGNVSRRKEPKSRNVPDPGCITCKARRMKCDEGKPSCQQCSRRGVTCGGYPKFLRWRPMGSVGDLSTDGEHGRFQGKRTESETQATIIVHSLEPSNTIQGNANSTTLQATTQPERPKEPIAVSISSQPLSTNSFNFGRNQPTAPTHRLGGDDVSYENLQAQGETIVTSNQSQADYGQIEEVADLTLQMNHTALQFHGELDWDYFHPGALFETTEATQEEVSQGFGWSISGLDLSTESTFEPGYFGQSSATLTGEGLHPPNNSGSNSPEINVAQGIQQRPHSQTDTVGPATQGFEYQTFEILSPSDDQTKNPWLNLIWPLASNCPALYHALAAMINIHRRRSRPQLQLQGNWHFQRSIDALAENEGKDSMPLEAAISTRLALSFAESWDDQKSSIGIEHIKCAKLLIRQAALNHHRSHLNGTEWSRFSFLANTCLYMDVIARLSCADTRSTDDPEFMAACGSLSAPDLTEHQLDTLMGCAITLFPMMGRLADLVGRVRARVENRNSPAIISKGIELRRAIEKWSPPVHSEHLADFDSNISDSIQTAEAYRWATLLLLRQAVPELPWRHSIWEMAQKTLVYLATVPLASPTIIAQIFPLIMAGCEAFEEDDRNWVRERWELMSKRMVTGTINRCREITAEVWRRRNEYEERHGSCHGVISEQRSPSTNSGAPSNVPAGRTANDALQDNPDMTRPIPVDRCPSPTSSDFPISAAFKKGIDPLTRAGFVNYLVKGNLHWLGVMKDWKWEVMLG